MSTPSYPQIPLTVGHWINGHETPDAGEVRMRVVDPGRDVTVGYAFAGGKSDVDAAVDAAVAGQRHSIWRDAAPAQRGRWLVRLGQLIERDAEQLAILLALEVGKPISQGRNEVRAASRYCEYYGGWADKIDGRTIPQPANAFACTLREPVGIIAQILPWNYPLDILLRGLSPALAAGNSVVIKPSELTPLCAAHVARLATEAGFPDGVINVVNGTGPVVGAYLAGHPRVQGVSFCGSAATGAAIVAETSKNLAQVISLELGGKSPSLVMQDGDVIAAARSAASGAVYNAGQSCAARTRLIVHKDQVDDAISVFRAAVADVRMGPGILDLGMGPLISRKQQRHVLEQIALGVQAGARILCGGHVPKDPQLEMGSFMVPTLLDQVDPGMDVARKEIFGPVVCLLSYAEESEALALANDTDYGLAAEVWTRDPGRALAISSKLNASHITVNSKGGLGLEVPFGGIGRSGYGREGGIEGLLQYTRVKSVWMKSQV